MRRGRLRTIGPCCVHVTHRCQEGRFLLRFKQDRRNYVKRLRDAIERTSVDLLEYVLTSNHVHLLFWTEDGSSVSRMMQILQGSTARDYNRRKNRRGAYWADRFHPTLVQTGCHLSRCLFYIGLNMVRARAVSHPMEWETSGYMELSGETPKAEIIQLDRLLWCLGMAGQKQEFQRWYRRTIEESCREYLVREPWWTEAAAVGSREWIETLAATIIVGRRHVEAVPLVGADTLRESEGSYILSTARRSRDALMAGL